MAAVYRGRIPREKALEALEVLAKGGKLSQADYLRCKVRYFSDGAVLGGKNFVEEKAPSVLKKSASHPSIHAAAEIATTLNPRGHA